MAAQAAAADALPSYADVSPPGGRRNPSGAAKHYVLAQEHLLRSSPSNPSPTTMPPPAAGLAAGALGDRHVVCFLGLPARGKQFMAERLQRYLTFFHGAQCEVFDLSGPELRESDAKVGDALAAYLEAEDASATTQLLRSAEGIDDDSLDRLKKNVDSGRIAILDSSDGFESRDRVWAGTSKTARYEMMKHLSTLRVHVKLLFIEVVVRDDRVVRSFLRSRLTDENMDEAQVQRKLAATERAIRDYGRHFVTIQDDGSEDDLSYVKLIDYGKKVITNNIRGFLLMQIVKYLSHVHPRPRTVYLSRHGQSLYNVEKKIGGNPGITAAGEQYAKWLGKVVPGEVWTTTHHRSPLKDLEDSTDEDEQSCSGRPLFGRLFPCVDLRTGTTSPKPIQPARLWTSTLKRTIDTARHIPHPVLELRDGGVWHQMSPRVYRNLDEIFAGDCEGLTYEEIERTHGDEARLRKRDKLGYRYPRGESYLDLIARLDPLMHELESYKEPLLVVSHQATLRVLYSYLVGGERRDAPKVEIPLHTLIKITWDGWRSIREERIAMEDFTAGLQDDGQKNH
uniref:6-phosphofructo-2-kinase domain-containing protein n=1 Tax=Pelagomonas calceolata TaxID=35677 RepID=A0A7S4A8H7_9STRA|mmetsp:Transcript_100/g.363  ORF Transcript_100/g.363 Transcript_100/m.363 type:complete len:565 (-) Transcript_100:57-1751(-)